MKDDRPYLEDIREALEDIAIYGSAGREAFFAERMRQDAILRKLQVIGQAVKNLSRDNESSAAKCPLEADRRFTRQSIHDYFGVNLDIVWTVIENELPKLKTAIITLLRSSK